MDLTRSSVSSVDMLAEPRVRWSSMSERLTDELRQKAEPIWQAQIDHPFIRGIAEGTLDVEKFRFWVKQDYVYLVEFCRLLAHTAARSPDLATMTRLVDVLQATLRTEMDLHRSYAAEFGISPEELEAEPKAPTTQAYTDFLVRKAVTGDLPEAVAALLPCIWGFSEIGRRLAREPRPQDERYAKWIDMYASEEFAELAAWGRDLLDRLAEGLPESPRRAAEEAFLTSSRFEWLFWEMGWRLERWRV